MMPLSWEKMFSANRKKGFHPLTAAVDGTIEVGRPVIFSVLTTMVAFWPLLMAGGTMGKLMRNIPIVVIAVSFWLAGGIPVCSPFSFGKKQGGPKGNRFRQKTKNHGTSVKLGDSKTVMRGWLIYASAGVM